MKPKTKVCKKNIGKIKQNVDQNIKVVIKRGVLKSFVKQCEQYLIKMELMNYIKTDLLNFYILFSNFGISSFEFI